MPKSEITITELSEFEPTRVDGVGKGANGFPILMLKGIEDEMTDGVAEVLAAVETVETAKAEKAECETCGGTGKILEGHRDCPDCGGEATKAESFTCETCRDTGKAFGKTCPDCEGKAAEATKAESFQCETCRDTGKAFGKVCPDCEGKSAEAAKEIGVAPSGVAPSGSGNTPATDCPTCKGDGKLRNGTHAGKSCPDCGGTGLDESRTNPEELKAMNADPGRISDGDPEGRERIDKANPSMVYAAANPSIATSTAATTSVSVTPDGSSDASPGSPAWEAIDAATATAAAISLMEASELIRTFAQRERMEVAAGEGNDIFDAGAAEAALVAVSQAIGVMAQLAFHEGMEAQKGQVEKAGKRLASKTITALAAARDYLNTVLGSDDPALADQDSGDGTGGNNAADKFIASANKALNSERNVLDMNEEELQKLVVETVAQAIVVAEATKGSVKKGKKDKKEDMSGYGDEKSSEDDDDDEDDDAMKADMTPEEIEANEAAKAARKELKAAKKAAKNAADQAAVTKAVETALAEVAKQTEGLNATIEKLTTDLDTVKKMAAPSSIVRTRPQEALTKSVERDSLEMELAKYENLAKSTNEPELRTGYNDRVKSIRSQIAAL